MNKISRFKLMKGKKRLLLSSIILLSFGSTFLTSNVVSVSAAVNPTISGLTVKGQTKLLFDTIHQYQTLQTNDYTQSSVTEFNLSLKKAVDFVHQAPQSHTAKEIFETRNNLINIKNKLVKKQVANKTSILKTIRAAQGINGWIYRDYTFQNMKQVLANAVNVYHDPQATQNDINQNDTKLKLAIRSLILSYNVNHDNDYSAQFLGGARQASYYINGKKYNFYITNQSGTHSNGRTNFVAAGCTENALANAMKVAGLLPNGFKVSDVAAKLWNIQTGGLNVNQGVSYYNQQSLATVGDYKAISMPKANSIISRTNSSMGLFQGKQNFVMVGSVYFGYGLDKNKAYRVANQIEQWRKQGYFISLMIRAAGSNASADHAVTLASLTPNFGYGKAINFIDSYHGWSGSNGLAQSLSNTQKVQYVYKAMAYKATDYNGRMIRSNY